MEELRVGAFLYLVVFSYIASSFPVLLKVFGSFLSHPLRPSDTFYGTGETFLFMLHPRFKVS